MFLVWYLKSYCHTQGHLGFLLSSRSPALCFRSMFHFELILSVKSELDFFFFCTRKPSCSSTIFRSVYLLHHGAFAPLSKIGWLRLFGSISGLCFVPLTSLLFFHQPHSLDNCGFLVSPGTVSLYFRSMMQHDNAFSPRDLPLLVLMQKGKSLLFK